MREGCSTGELNSEFKKAVKGAAQGPWLALPHMAPKSCDRKCSQSGEELTPLLLLNM